MDGDYFPLFHAKVISMCGRLVDLLPQPGGAKTLRTANLSAHEFAGRFVSVSVAKHGIRTIVIGTHLQCAAYEKFGLSLSEEEALQRQHIERAVRFLNDYVPMGIQHYLKEEKLPEHEVQNLETVLESGIIIQALLIKPYDMSRRIKEPSEECFVEQVL
ncbi:MAG: carbonic anhydrase [Patescibacteria group bacterium]|jgi:hypothetical protein